MKRLILIFGIILCVGINFLHASTTGSDYDKKQTDKKAADLVRSALEAMGGEAKLRALTSVKFSGIGHTYAVEQSERPEGPFIVAYEQIKETRDLAGSKLRRESEFRQGQLPEWTGSTIVVSDGVAAMQRGDKFAPGSIVQVNDAERTLALAPERLLLTALEAADLRVDKETTMQSVPQYVVRFTFGGIPVTIYLNANTNLPTAVQTLSASPYEHFWSVWGDFTTRIFYSYWTLEQGGIRYPHQLDEERNNYPYRSLTITDIKLNEAVDASTLTIPDDIRKAYAARPATKIDDLPLGIPNRPAVELAPGVVKLPGRWDVSFIAQEDGVVILEAPIGSGYSAKVISEAKRRFPNLPVKAVITTSDAFPHLGGVREYVAQNVPVYALDANRPLLDRIIAARHTIEPDALERAPRKAKFVVVSKKTTLGTGPNRLEIYPIRSESGERMMMVYFPEHRLLYGSDLVQKMRDGNFFMPQYLAELMQAVTRENLAVDNVISMHGDKLPWTEITSAVGKYN